MKLQYDEPPPIFVCNFNLRRYIKEARGGVTGYWSHVTANMFLSVYDGFEPSIVAAVGIDG